MVAPQHEPASSTSSSSPSDPSSPSAKRIAANRRNAQLSTGPRTEAGKASSRMNAVVHGLCATLSVLPGEDCRTFHRFGNAIYASLRPADQAEGVLVDQYVSLSWKLRRLGDVEEALDYRSRDRQEQEANAAHRNAIVMRFAKKRTKAQQRLDELVGLAPLPNLKEPPKLSEWTVPADRVPPPLTAGEMLADELIKGEGPLLRLMDLEDRIRRTLARTIKELKDYRILRQAQRDAEDDGSFTDVPADQEMDVNPFRPEAVGPEYEQYGWETTWAEEEEEDDDDDGEGEAVCEGEAVAVAATAPVVEQEPAKPQTTAGGAPAVRECPQTPANVRSDQNLRNEPNAKLRAAALKAVEGLGIRLT